MIYLCIFNFKISIKYNSDLIEKRIKVDFNHFITNTFDDANLSIECNLENKLSLQIPSNLSPIFQRQNSITYDYLGVRYNDYYGKVISIFNYQQSTFLAHGVVLDKLYEVIYLFILSRSGKFLDSIGMHKIHGFSVSNKEKTLICVQPTRGGKSTLFSHLLINTDLLFGSDDTPLISRKTCQAFSFPIHVNLEKLPDELQISEEMYYLQKREFYGAKYSISTSCYKNSIAPPNSNLIFLFAERSTYETPQLVKISKIKFFNHLIKNLIIGIGLPIIFEYFWESGVLDFILKVKIFFSRFYLSLKLVMLYQGYCLKLSNDVERNAKFVNAILSDKTL